MSQPFLPKIWIKVSQLVGWVVLPIVVPVFVVLIAEEMKLLGDLKVACPSGGGGPPDLFARPPPGPTLDINYQKQALF